MPHTENTHTSEKASDAARSVFLRSFSFLSAFVLRDLIMRIWDEMVNTKGYVFWKIVVSQLLLFMIVFGVTTIVAINWIDYETNII
jgi:hypothetical protein